MGQYEIPSRTFRGLADEIRLVCSNLAGGLVDRPTFLEQCTRLTNAVIGCSRAGIWIFVDTGTGRVLRCLAMYDADADRMTRVPDEKREVQPYFDALEREGFVSANDTSMHPATNGILAGHLGAKGVRSLLASSFAVNGHLFGALTCTQVGQQKEWTPRQLATLREIGGPASLALYRASRFTPDAGLGSFAG